MILLLVWRHQLYLNLLDFHHGSLKNDYHNPHFTVTKKQKNKAFISGSILGTRKQNPSGIYQGRALLEREYYSREGLI